MSPKIAHCRRHVVGLLILAAGLGMLNAPGASAETYPVKNTAELTAAIAKANAKAEANTIVLEGGIYVPLKTFVLKNTSGPLTIEGPSGSPAIKGKAASITGTSVEPTFDQLFVVEGGVSVTLRNLEIGGGGGLGTPAIEVLPKGNLTIEGTTLEGNTGSGVLVDGEGTLAVRNSTISEDSEFGVLDDGTASFFNATVAFNTDGGLQNEGTLNLTNTIVAENSGSGDCVGAATTSDHSLDSDGSCGVGALSDKKPLLQSALLNDGGTTPLHLLKPGSPAIGAGDEAQCPTTDQRGAHRADPCSIGADEYNSTPPTITVPAEIVAEEENEEGAVVSYAASAAGYENAIRTFSCVPASESTFPKGTTVVTCTAVDGHENKATKSFNVKVTAKRVAPVAPTVVTGAASSVTQTTATVNATVNPNGAEVTECTFEYGTTTAYGKTAPCASLPGSGTSAVAVSASLTGLVANATYHFRISATNVAGTNKGSDATFTTLPNPPTVVTGSASSVAQTTATLNATVNPNGGNVSACTFEYGTTTAYGKTAPCASLPGSGTSAVAVSAAITGLTANTTYHFRISATNAGGTSTGSDATFTTPPNPPTVVTGSASSVTQTTATLNATVNPNGGNVSACTFEYGTTTSYGSTALCASLPGSGTSAVAVSAAITGLTANTTYHFRISATNAGGTSTGSDATFTTPPNPPTVVTGSASSVTQATATLNATVNPNGGNVSACTFEYGTSTAYGETAPCASLPGSGTSAVAVSASLTGLTANTTYHFRISATNAGGTNHSSDATFTTLAPVAPTVVTGSASSVAQTTATLTATVNPNGGNVSECTFEYGTSTAYGETAPCASLPGSGTSAVAVSASLTGLTANTTYHFRISATNVAGTNKGSDATFTTLPNPPTVVTGSASSVAQTTATLTATVNPNGGNVSECTFEYGTSTAYGETAPCASLPGSGTSAVAVSASLTGLTANTTYHFRISATNAGGTSKGADATFTTAEETKVQQKTESKVEVLPSIEKQEPVPDVTSTVDSASVSTHGVFVLKLSCPEEDKSCSGTVTVRTLTAVLASRGYEAKSKKPKAAILTLASGSFTLSGGQVKVLTLHLSSEARALLSRVKVLRVGVTIVAHDAAGVTHTTQENVTLRAARAR